MRCTIDSFENMALSIRGKDSKIIIFGAGVIGTVTMLELLREYQIEDKITFYIDNDERKWNQKIDVFDRKVSIQSPAFLHTIESQNFVILLTVSRYSEILNQLEEIENIKDMTCYLIPFMCTANFHTYEKETVIKDAQSMRIPKIIHYMWLGGKTIPDTLRRCIESWRKYCPDYEIKRWDESNYDLSQHPYMKEAYEMGAYGFVPDYARLDILYRYGGIYLDTDVELVQNLDPMLFQDGFCCVEKWQTVNFGGGSGCVKGNQLVGAMLKTREHLHYIDGCGNANRNTCGFYDTRTAIQKGYKLNGRIQKVVDMNIYPYEYFHPYDYMSGKVCKTVNTYGIHHFNGGWLDDKMKAENQKAVREYDALLERMCSRK